ncbi:MAG: ABC transporter permease [candidate division WOR-3 bacterium]|nr:MAG: ABC transporter permease [candidate division WOR-3 bacterium]
MWVIIEEVRKSFRILLAYPVEVVFWIFSPLLWVIPLVFQGKALIGAFNSTSFGSLAGTDEFIPYVLIGAIVSTYMFSAVWSMGNSFRDETYYGTLEHILSAPVRPGYILIGKGLYNSILSTSFVIVQLLICVFIFGLNITLAKIFPIFLFLLLLIVGLYGIGFMAAALTLLIKEAHGMLHMFEYVLFLFSPIRYPVEVNPITKAISVFIPLTYALIALRGLLLNIEFNFWKNSIVLLAIDCTLLPLGLFVFRRIEKRTKTRGTLADY